jgi:hypothetical protein
MVSAISTIVEDNTGNAITEADIRTALEHAFDTAASGAQVGRVYATSQADFAPPAAVGGKWRVVKDTDFQGGLTMTDQDYVIFHNCQISGATALAACDNVLFMECFIESSVTLTTCTNVSFVSCEEDQANRIVTDSYETVTFVDHKPKPDASSPWDNIPPFPEDMRANSWWFDPRAVTDSQIADVLTESYGLGYGPQCKPINPLTHCVTDPSYFSRVMPILERGGRGEALWKCRHGQTPTAKLPDGTPQDGSILYSLKNRNFAYDDDWVKGTGWTIANRQATKTAGTASKLVSSALGLRPNEVITIKFDVTVTAGSVSPRFGANADGSGSLAPGTASTTTESVNRSVSTAGSYGDQYLVFDASSDFAGSISNVEVRSIDRSTAADAITLAVGTPTTLPNDYAPGFTINNQGMVLFDDTINCELVADQYFPSGSTGWTRTASNPSDWLFFSFAPRYSGSVIGGAIASDGSPIIVNSQYINNELRFTIGLKYGTELERVVHAAGNETTPFGPPIVENKWYRHRINVAISRTNAGYFRWEINGEEVLNLTGINLGQHDSANTTYPSLQYVKFGSYIASWNDGVGDNDPMDDTTNVLKIPGILDYVDLYYANIAVKVTALP